MYNEVVKCGLPETKRPSEPENETDINDCINRVAANDPSLTKINLNNMKRTPIPQIQRLIVALVDNTNLKQLSLANTGLTDSGAEPLVQVIRYNRGLTSLNLETNFLSGDFFARFFHYALENEVLEEVKSVNQSSTISTNHERAIIDAIFENQNLCKVSINMRLPESRFYIEKAMLRNSENRRKKRRAMAQQNGPTSLDPRLQGLKLQFDPSIPVGQSQPQQSNQNYIQTNNQMAQQIQPNPYKPLNPVNQEQNQPPIQATNNQIPYSNGQAMKPATLDIQTNGHNNTVGSSPVSPPWRTTQNNVSSQREIQSHESIKQVNSVQQTACLQRTPSTPGGQNPWLIRQESANGVNIQSPTVPVSPVTDPEFKTQSTFVLRKPSITKEQPLKTEPEYEKPSQNNEILQARSRLNKVETRKQDVEELEQQEAQHRQMQQQQQQPQQSAPSNVPSNIPRPPPAFFLPDPDAYNGRPYEEAGGSRPKITAAMLQESPIFNALRKLDMEHEPTKKFEKFGKVEAPKVIVNHLDPRFSASNKVMPQPPPVRQPSPISMYEPEPIQAAPQPPGKEKTPPKTLPKPAAAKPPIAVPMEPVAANVKQVADLQSAASHGKSWMTGNGNAIQPTTVNQSNTSLPNGNIMHPNMDNDINPSPGVPYGNIPQQLGFQNKQVSSGPINGAVHQQGFQQITPVSYGATNGQNINTYLPPQIQSPSNQFLPPTPANGAVQSNGFGPQKIANKRNSFAEQPSNQAEKTTPSWVKVAPVGGQSFRAGPPWARGGGISIDS